MVYPINIKPEDAMKRLIIALLALISLGGGMTAQTGKPSSLYSEYGFAIVVFKYNHAVAIMGRAEKGGELHVGITGSIYRVFPTGPKIAYGDGRIPEGIYHADISENGDVSFLLVNYGMLEFAERFTVTGPSLDRNVIPLREDAIESVRWAAERMYASGYRTIPLVILPGSLEPEVAELIEKARNVREGYTLEDIQASCRRWRPVENFIIQHGQIPGVGIPPLKFDEENIILPAMPTETDPPIVTGSNYARN